MEPCFKAHCTGLSTRERFHDYFADNNMEADGDVEARLDRVLKHLENEHHDNSSAHSHSHHLTTDLETWDKLKLLKSLLCLRSPEEELPENILEDVDEIYRQELRHHVLVPSSSIPPARLYSFDVLEPTQKRIRIHLWKGDITKLTEVTAIVNAANSQLLGCFQPRHLCIDNAIHSGAGPRLRVECHRLMLAQGTSEPVGNAKVTSGYNLPTEFVIHTVGPQLSRGQEPAANDRKELAKCYKQCLEAAERLPALTDGRKVLAFCCISTGLFAFPGGLAANIAVDSVFRWLGNHPSTTISDIIFNVFTDTDFEYYSEILHSPSLPREMKEPEVQLEGESLDLAVKWLKEADSLVISAGAGLSAADGLDYTSSRLFRTHFPAFLELGLRRLYDVFGFRDWPSTEVEWGYFFLHLAMVRDWPESKIYGSLLELARTFGDRFHVRTSNTDGLFLANGFDEMKTSTPQGQYTFLQCYDNCRPDATFLSAPYLDAALPHVDLNTQVLRDPTKVPHCEYCGGRMAICVRGGNYFNERPFADGEGRWKEFMDQNIESSRNMVILELGVGLSTAGVLRWPNEDFIQRYGGRVKLIRVGMGPAGIVPWGLEEEGNAIGVNGDLTYVVPHLKQSRV